jgi:hypothetical protein
MAAKKAGPARPAKVTSSSKKAAPAPEDAGYVEDPATDMAMEAPDTAPLPDPFEGKNAVLVADRTPEAIARAAYNKVRAATTSGNYGEWDECSKWARANFLENALHVIDGGEPRSAFEKAVAEVLHD